jgi:hypothetical protein
MEKGSEAVLLRIFIGESDKYEGVPLYQYLLRFFRERGFAGATVLRGIGGFGKRSKIHTADILRLSTDLPIVVGVVDTKEKVDSIKPELERIIGDGLVTEERVTVVCYRARAKKRTDR